MIESFFRSLERENVSYLLLGGQAAVLYGAATFSEDIDLWVEPSADNVGAFLRALQRREARYYKLCPPMEPDLLLSGHGFHFVVADDPDVYLDAMGRPPRVPSFAVAAGRAVRMRTPWGILPTVSIPDLVALKKTQRLGDYTVIGSLVLRHLEGLAQIDAADLGWALENVFTADDVDALAARVPAVARVACDSPGLVAYLRERSERGEASPRSRAALEEQMSLRVLDAQRADRAYWAPIIAELRELRRCGRLMPEGAVVTAPGAA